MLVLGNDYKHPAVVAKEAATLDVLSGGRLEFGLGAGWMTADYRRSVCPYDSPGVRIARLGEALAVVKGAWGDGPFDFEGDHYRITGVRRLPKPVQQPRPPILVGGGGRKVLSLAGREADIVGINPILRAGRSAPTPPATRSATRRGARSAGCGKGAGERFDDARAPDPLLRGRDHRRARSRSPRPWRRRSGCRPTRRSASGAVLAGTVDQVCDTLVARREEWGVSYVVFGDDQYEQFAPVVARLAGT